MEEILNKIQKIRKDKGFSYENVAHDLNISSGAYRKIEMNQTKLTIERLYQIAESLDVRVEDLLELKSEHYEQNYHDNSTGYQQREIIYQENKEITEKLIAQLEARLQEKDELIKLLREKLKG